MHTQLPLTMPKLHGSALHMQGGQAAELCMQRCHTDAHSSTFCLSRKRRCAVELVSLHKKGDTAKSLGMSPNLDQSRPQSSALQELLWGTQGYCEQAVSSAGRSDVM